jgi:hypothetical protein
MNSITDNNVPNIEEDDYGFFCEFEQTISSDNIDYTNQRNYKIDKNILKKLNNKYKYTILNQNFLPIPMLKKNSTYYNFNLFKNRSPKSSKVMPILDDNYTQNNLQYNTKKENFITLKHKIFIHSVLMLSLFISILLMFL